LSTASIEDGDADDYPQSIPTVGNNDNAADTNGA